VARDHFLRRGDVPHTPGNPEDALKAADKLMYEVKAAGKDASREVVFERGPSELRHSSGTEGELPD